MSLAAINEVNAVFSLPRTCGDEPAHGSSIRFKSDVCPAPAGMSPASPRAPLIRPRLPRTCGDEPEGDVCDLASNMSAPHLRG